MVRLELDRNGLVEPSIPVSIQGCLALAEWDTFYASIQTLHNNPRHHGEHSRVQRSSMLSLLVLASCLLPLLLIVAARSRKFNGAAVVMTILLVVAVGSGWTVVWIQTVRTRLIVQKGLREACRKMTNDVLKFKLVKREGDYDAIEIVRVGDDDDDDNVEDDDGKDGSTDAVKDLSIIDVVDLGAIDQETETTTDDDEEIGAPNKRQQAGPKPDMDTDEVSLNPPKRSANGVYD